MNKNFPAEKTAIENLLKLMAAYQKSQTLFTFVELGIADLLDCKCKSANQISDALGIQPLAMNRFLNACVIIGLLAKDGETYANTELAGKYLVSRGEFYLGGQVERHRKRSSPAWSKLTESLRKWDYGEDNGEEDPEADDQGSEAMTEQHNLALLHGTVLADNFDFSKHKRILDLGGGTAATSIALCRKHPHLQSVVFDLPENTDAAQKFVVEAKLEQRIEVVAGDFKKDNLPDGFDLVVLANFMAVADAEENIKLLKKLYDKLPAGGACLISGWILDDSQLAPDLAVLFCLEDICWNAPDVERSEKVYTDWLETAGFTGIRCKSYLPPTKLLYGFKI
jgi:3-hydroxy-5-methyl-1-naphthoate 3-O-methyltransferase